MKIMKQIIWTLMVLAMLAGCSGRGDDGNEDNTNPNPGSEFPSVGIPDQNSLSLVADVLNPRAYDYDGTEINVTVRLADQLNNNSTIADGRNIYFATEGGSIEPMCSTVNGACSVIWTSQNPRPPASVDSGAGRATILAWTLGSESFIDNNSNGLFDDGDTFNSAAPADTDYDRGEPFIDKNENGARETNEEFVNYPIPQIGSGGVYSTANGLYAGPNCSHSTLCDLDQQSIFIFDNLEISMSSDNVYVLLLEDVAGDGLYTQLAVADTIDLVLPQTFYYVIIDANGNPPPVGTSISFDADVGEMPDVSIDTISTNRYIGGSPWDSDLVHIRRFTVAASEVSTGAAGSLSVTVNVPDVLEKTYNMATLVD